MGSLKRPDDWDYNPQFSSTLQPNLCDRSYVDTDTYSRGHVIPNASRNGIREMQLQTFYVTNSVPQIQNNFNGGIWANLEAALQSVAKTETIYIVTGSVLNKVGESKAVSYTTPKDDTSKKCAIPNYFYTVVLRVNKSGDSLSDAQAVGFWFEHKDYSNNAYEDYTVSVNQIEEWTGFDFFVNLPDDLEAEAERNSSWTTLKNF